MDTITKELFDNYLKLQGVRNHEYDRYRTRSQNPKVYSR